MSNVVYREMLKKDYSVVKNLIGEAFGFNDFIEDENLLDVVLSTYLQNCILESSFSKVAVKDDKVIGFILGNAKADKNLLTCDSEALGVNDYDLELIMTNKENIELLKELSKITDTYKELIKGLEDKFQGSIQLFVVSKESRGLGVGKALVSYLSDYMKSMNVKSLYLYTDTRCNYGFYDSQGFNLVAEKEIYFDCIKTNLNVFLYEYQY